MSAVHRIANFCRCCMLVEVDLYLMKTLQFQSMSSHGPVQLFDTFWECSGVVKKPTMADIDADAKICLNCKLQLESVYNFRALCKRSDETLQSLFGGEEAPQLVGEVKVEKAEFELTNPNFYAAELPSTSSSESPIFLQPPPAQQQQPHESWSTLHTPKTDNFSTEREVLCKKCGESSRSIVDHEANHCAWRPLEFVDEQTQRRKFQCRKCMKVYAAKISFQQHIRTDHKKIRFSCPVCMKEFKSRHGLRSHMVSHTRDYPFVCPVKECHYKGAQNYAFKVHLQNHHNIKSIESKADLPTLQIKNSGVLSDENGPKNTF